MPATQSSTNTRPRRRLMQQHRKDVERTLSLQSRVDRMQQQLDAYDIDEDGFRQRVAEHRAAWWTCTVFILALCLYVAGDLFASSEVAVLLAEQVSPLLFVQPGIPPIWLRLSAGISFVLIMLGVTLLVKFVSTTYAHRWKEERAGLTNGEDARNRQLTLGIWGTYLAKGFYLVAVAFLYVWLFGFARERGRFLEDLARNDTQHVDSSSVIVVTDGEVQSLQSPSVQPENAAPDEVGSKLAWGIGIVYILLWIIHALVLILPADAFGQDKELAGFKRSRVAQRVEKAQERIDRTCRDMLERIHSVDGADREALIRESQPLVHQINKAAGRQIMEGPPPGHQPPPHVGPPPVSFVPSGPTSSTPSDLELSDSEPPDSSEEGYAAVFGARHS